MFLTSRATTHYSAPVALLRATKISILSSPFGELATLRR
jgi:hypothetical protein